MATLKCGRVTVVTTTEVGAAAVAAVAGVVDVVVDVGSAAEDVTLCKPLAECRFGGGKLGRNTNQPHNMRTEKRVRFLSDHRYGGLPTASSLCCGWFQEA